jgi:hypothetical protein
MIILFISHKISSNDCSGTCQMSKKNCYRPSDCPIIHYLVNPDFFVMYIKNDVKYLNYSLKDVQRELREVQDVHKSEWGYMKSSLRHLKERRNYVNQIKQSTNQEIRTRFGTLVKIFRSTNITIRTEIIIETKEEIQISNYGQDVQPNPLNELEFDLTYDVNALADFLKQHQNDTVRDALIYPDNCEGQCLINYQVIFSIWGRVAKRLSLLLKAKFRTFKRYKPKKDRCLINKKRIQKWFESLLRPYPRQIYLILKDYLQFLVLDKLCDSNWVVIH